MSARIKIVAADVETLLNAALGEDPMPFPLPFTVHRTYIPRHKPEELTERRLYIVPTDNTSERASKVMFEEKYEVSLGLQYKPGQTESEDEACDAQLELAEKIIGYLREHKLPSNIAPFMGSQYAPLFDADIFDTYGILTTVFVITYQGWK